MKSENQLLILGAALLFFSFYLVGRKVVGRVAMIGRISLCSFFILGETEDGGGKVVEIDGMLGSVVVNAIGIGVLTIWG